MNIITILCFFLSCFIYAQDGIPGEKPLTINSNLDQMLNYQTLAYDWNGEIPEKKLNVFKAALAKQDPLDIKFSHILNEAKKVSSEEYRKVFNWQVLEAIFKSSTSQQFAHIVKQMSHEEFIERLISNTFIRWADGYVASYIHKRELGEYRGYEKPGVFYLKDKNLERGKAVIQILASGSQEDRLKALYLFNNFGIKKSRELLKDVIKGIKISSESLKELLFSSASHRENYSIEARKFYQYYLKKTQINKMASYAIMDITEVMLKNHDVDPIRKIINADHFFEALYSQILSQLENSDYDVDLRERTDKWSDRLFKLINKDQNMYSRFLLETKSANFNTMEGDLYIKTLEKLIKSSDFKGTLSIITVYETSGLSMPNRIKFRILKSLKEVGKLPTSRGSMSDFEIYRNSRFYKEFKWNIRYNYMLRYKVNTLCGKSYVR